MSYLIFDFRCPICGAEARDHLVKAYEIRPPECEEGHPMTQMDKLPAGTRTNFTFADSSATKR